MSQKKIAKEVFDYLEALYAAGAIKKGARGSVEINTAARAQLSAFHATLAGGTDNKVYRDLEAAFEAAWMGTSMLAGQEGDVDAVYWP